jgi:ribose 5-phosphate isomerase A
MEQEKIKKAVGYLAAELISDGMAVGLGTGSTVFYFIERLSQRVKEGLCVRAVCSSLKSEGLAKLGNIPLVDINTLTHLDITVDGADEIDPLKRMIKGGGGALLREKILASMSREMIVIVDESKLCQKLGKHKLPIEITPFGHLATAHRLINMGFDTHFRQDNKGDLFITDNGNLIIDLHFSSLIDNPEQLEMMIRKIPGIVETGLFFNLAGRVIIGFKDGQVVTKP